MSLQLHEAVEQEIDKMLTEALIRRVEKVSDEVFIQPMVITVKLAKNVKIALDDRSINIAIPEEKYQMPKLDKLMAQVAEIISTNEEGTLIIRSHHWICCKHMNKQNCT